MDTKTNLKPASKDTEESYEPTAMGMSHDPFFASVAPGVADSGNLKHKWSIEGDHSNSSEPPSNLKGD